MFFLQFLVNVYRVKFVNLYDTRCYFNVRSKADISQLNLSLRVSAMLMLWCPSVTSRCSTKTARPDRDCSR